MVCGQRFAYSVATAFGYGGKNLYSGTNGQAPGVPNMGPILKSVTRGTSGGFASLTLKYDLPNGTSLSTRGGGGIGSTVYAFDIGTSSASAVAAWSARIDTGFVSTITASDTITIVHGTLTSWPTYVSLSYAESYPVFTGNSNGAADSASLQQLLCDNMGGYDLPAAWMTAGLANSIPAPAGNAAACVLDWAA